MLIWDVSDHRASPMNSNAHFPAYLSPFILLQQDRELLALLAGTYVSHFQQSSLWSVLHATRFLSHISAVLQSSDAMETWLQHHTGRRSINIIVGSRRSEPRLSFNCSSPLFEWNIWPRLKASPCIKCKSSQEELKMSSSSRNCLD